MNSIPSSRYPAIVNNNIIVPLIFMDSSSSNSSSLSIASQLFSQLPNFFNGIPSNSPFQPPSSVSSPPTHSTAGIKQPIPDTKKTEAAASTIDTIATKTLATAQPKDEGKSISQNSNTSSSSSSSTSKSNKKVAITSTVATNARSKDERKSTSQNSNTSSSSSSSTSKKVGVGRPGFWNEEETNEFVAWVIKQRNNRKELKKLKGLNVPRTLFENAPKNLSFSHRKPQSMLNKWVNLVKMNGIKNYDLNTGEKKSSGNQVLKPSAQKTTDRSSSQDNNEEVITSNRNTSSKGGSGVKRTMSDDNNTLSSPKRSRSNDVVDDNNTSNSSDENTSNSSERDDNDPIGTVSDSPKTPQSDDPNTYLLTSSSTSSSLSPFSEQGGTIEDSSDNFTLGDLTGLQ